MDFKRWIICLCTYLSRHCGITGSTDVSLANVEETRSFCEGSLEDTALVCITFSVKCDSFDEECMRKIRQDAEWESCRRNKVCQTQIKVKKGEKLDPYKSGCEKDCEKKVDDNNPASFDCTVTNALARGGQEELECYRCDRGLSFTDLCNDSTSAATTSEQFTTTPTKQGSTLTASSPTSSVSPPKHSPTASIKAGSTSKDPHVTDTYITATSLISASVGTVTSQTTEPSTSISTSAETSTYTGDGRESSLQSGDMGINLKLVVPVIVTCLLVGSIILAILLIYWKRKKKNVQTKDSQAHPSPDHNVNSPTIAKTSDPTNITEQYVGLDHSTMHIDGHPQCQPYETLQSATYESCEPGTEKNGCRFVQNPEYESFDDDAKDTSDTLYFRETQGTEAKNCGNYGEITGGTQDTNTSANIPKDNVHEEVEYLELLQEDDKLTTTKHGT